MAKKTLEFLETYSVGQFKSEINVESVDIIKNPQTDKVFFSAGKVTGAVGDGYKENPVFSRVRGDDGEEFWLLHKRTSTAIDTL